MTHKKRRLWLEQEGSMVPNMPEQERDFGLCAESKRKLLEKGRVALKDPKNLTETEL